MASPDDTKDASTEPHLHPVYCWGDVHFLSSDNLLFVCDSRALTRSSTVFRDMVETAQGDAKRDGSSSSDSCLTGGSSKDSPIEIGEPSALLVKFLDMLISSQNIIDLSSVTPIEIAHIVRLCDKFDCDTSVVDNIKRQVTTLWKHDP
ncbi:hypothetical protein IAT38_002399 [Cryptococcus sp. DSM 104549]